MTVAQATVLALAIAQPDRSPTIEVAVDPRIELLAAVQVTSGYRRTITRYDIAYKQAMLDYFAPHREHDAVRRYAAMPSFTFDAPVSAMVHLSDPPELAWLAPCPEETVRRAGGRESLEAFVEALRDFARASDFSKFFDEHHDLYAQIVAAVRAKLGGISAETLERYYGEERQGYHIVVTPMFHHGGFGPRVVHPDGREVIYGVLGPHGVEDGAPTFGAADDFRYLVWHEFSHSFVNPVVDRNGDAVDRFASLFEPIAAPMKRQAYPAWRTCVYEHVVRAVTTRFAARELGPEQGRKALEHEQSRSFVYAEPLCAALEEYERSRERYPTFDDFFPRLLEVFEAARAQADMAAAEPQAPRPRVVRTTPAAGADDVDPALAEIVVEFDLAMNPGGFSFVQRDPASFPKTAGPPRWPAPTTCALPVRLEPGRRYWIGINTGRFTGFSSEAGRAAEPYEIEFTTAPAGANPGGPS